MIELTAEQRQALAAQNGEPVRVVDPATHDAYVLMRAELYEQRVGLIPNPSEESAVVVPPLFRRSQEAFWRRPSPAAQGLANSRKVGGLSRRRADRHRCQG